MSKKFPECPVYNHDNCRDLHNPKICAIVKEDKICLRKHQKSRKTEFKETIKRIKDQKPKLEAFLNTKEGHTWHQHYRGKKRTSTIKDIGEYVYWKHEGLWVGYSKEYPEHLSQGETVMELKEGLLKIYKYKDPTGKKPQTSRA